MTNISRVTQGHRRAFDALLHSAGACSVILRVPAPAVAGDNTEQLGLVTPLFQDVELGPVVFRTCAPRSNGEHELLIPARAVETLSGSEDGVAAQALFASASAVVIGQETFSIAAVSELRAGSEICGYRLTLRRPAVSA